jgi:phosphatidylglycerophosphate synthase
MTDPALAMKARASASAASAPPRPAASNARPLEIEEPLNRYVVHPISAALVELLAPTAITPNMVSVLGVVMMAAACACYAGLAWPWNALIGLLFHVAWHVFDGADGQLARRTGKSSPIGEIVDGVCDHVAHVILYVVIALVLQPTMGPWAFVASAVSGFSRAAQAMSYETTRRNYRRWVYSVNWIRQDVGKAARAGGPFGRAGAALAGLYLAAARWVRADDARIDALMARLVADERKAPTARALYQGEMQGQVKRASWLSTNWETLGVAASFLAGSPLWFLLFQAAALNAVMAWSVSSQTRSYARLAPKLEALERG